jgi:hypothetical protein
MSNVTRVSVDSGRMKNNLPNAIRVERDGHLGYAEEVRVGNGRFVTSHIPRPYGATIWFETTEPVVMCMAPDEWHDLEAAA